MQLIVLGMHRSGTSVLMRLLNLMGAYFGPEGVSTGANEENPKGFWERWDVRALNDMLLHSAGADWNRVTGFDISRVPEQALQEFRKQASRLILDMDAHRPWAMKEPRLCLLFPIWAPLLEAPVIVQMLRHPVEVASSLRKRNDIPIEAGLALWEKYVCDSVRHSGDLPVVRVEHSRLIKSPVKTVSELHEQLRAFGVEALRLPSDAEISSFVTNKLYRERSRRKELQEFRTAPEIKLYKRLIDENADPSGLESPVSPERAAALLAYETTLPPMPDAAAGAQKAIAEGERVKRLEAEVIRIAESTRCHGSEIARSRNSAQESQATFDVLKAEVIHQLEIVQQKESGLRELAARLEKAAARESDLLDELDKERRASVSKEVESGRLRVELAERLAERDRFEHAVAEKDQVVSDLSEKLSRVEAECAAFSAELEGLRPQLAEKDRGLVARTENIRQLKAELSASAAEIKSLRDGKDREVEARFSETEQLTRMLIAREKEMEEVEKLLDIWRDRIEKLEGSTSWRMTAPFRAARGLIRGKTQGSPRIRRADADVISSSDWFDAAWYVNRYPDVQASGLDAVTHYLAYGADEGRDPGPNFDTRFYLSSYPDVASAKMNPLLHFLRHGKSEGRAPHPG